MNPTVPLVKKEMISKDLNVLAVQKESLQCPFSVWVLAVLSPAG